ncbi:MAG: hydroxyacylglutathione hydrolase [Rhodospirillaceae bacterium]
MPLDIHQIPVLNDNYVYLIRNQNSGKVGVVDPAVATPVLKQADDLGWVITHIFNTHHHGDHTGANLEIKSKTNCTIVGPGHDKDRIPGIDIEVNDTDTFAFGDSVAQIFFVPGHTRGHIAYWFEDSDALFCGDTLFSVGCGRVFEGTMDQMWSSLSRLRALPPQTRVYCAHEYTQSNIKFAVSVDPDNAALRAREAEVKTKRDKGQPTVPSLLGNEVAVNPFLRADQADLQQAIGMVGASPVDVFTEVRQRKDNF